MASVPAQVRALLSRALEEDLGPGDFTSECVVPASLKGTARIRTKQDAVVAGLIYAGEVFHQIDPAVRFSSRVREGAGVRTGDVLCTITGPARAILGAERVSLNVLQRLSGIATLTRRFVEAVRGFDVRIADTRKTTPGLRVMEKYAVAAGGGINHRFGLSDGILIKDNHIAAAGGILKAMQRAKKAHHLLRIEIEVKNLRELRDALRAGADVIMLDNMPLGMLRRAVRTARSAQKVPLIEASGNVSLDTVRDIAATGVDLISVGALTHSAPAVDMSLDFSAVRPRT